MAYATSFTTSSTASTRPALFRQSMNLFRQRIAEYRTRARMRTELNSYSDRHLSDMGLSRSDIEDVVRHQFAR